MGLLRRFKDFCAKSLWQGVCGRCGSIGDHFADDCPVISQPQAPVEDLLRGALAPDCWGLRYCLPCRATVERAFGAQPQEAHYKILNSSPCPRARRHFTEFLRAHHLTGLEPLLQRSGLQSLHDLEELPRGELELLLDGLEHGEDVAAIPKEPLLQALSPAAVGAWRERLTGKARDAFAILGSQDHHLFFLSHYKAEAGTEAALMRTELEQLIAAHPELPPFAFDVPVFLDSDNLSDLEQLQEHVSNSHNVVLLLTQHVLTRPWVIVELATAVRKGVPVLPVNVHKEGDGFVFPTDTFYSQLRRGSVLDRGGMEVLDSCKVTLAEVEMAMRKVFKRIALSFSPHGSADLRQAELQAIVRKCAVFGHSEDAAPDRHRRQAAWAVKPL